ncbi:MAG: hypothetical protein WDO13_16580 [Verrucomicrobiota bacterium]
MNLSTSRAIRAVVLGLLLAGALLLNGCSAFNSSMASPPERTGLPPYADDPEANGNPAKAWWN